MKRLAVSLAVAGLAVAALTLPVSADHRRPRTERFDLVEATVQQMQEALSSGLITSERLVRMYRARIAAYDDVGPRLNAYLHVNANAVRDARRIDRQREDGDDHRGKHGRDDDDRGPLFGIPVLLKDNVNTRDMPTTAGSVALEGMRPPRDAFIARRLRNAGAIFLGKATLTEFANFIAIGMPSGFSSLARKFSGDNARGGYGFNPYDTRTDPRTGLDPQGRPLNDGRPALTPGGSSSGSGIGVAANLAAVSIGTETSGSILSPGSANMDVGIKPTVGLVSRSGIIPITADQDTAGPITRTVTDAAIVLGVIAGFDPDDPATAACKIPGNCFRNYTRFLNRNALRGARIAVPPFPANRADIMNPAIEVLRARGATVDLVDPLAPQLGICVSVPAPADCSTVLMYGQKHDLDDYLATIPRGRRPNGIDNIADIVAFNAAFNPPMKYGQAIFEAASSLDTRPGSADTIRYFNDLAEDRRRSRAAIGDVLDGPDNTPGTADDYDAILFSANSGAGTPAKAGYPSITVPGGFSAPAINAETGQPLTNPLPSGVTFSAGAFSEPTLIGFAYDFEQATKHRVPPASAPPLPSDTVVRRR